jgi:hypothetical protein
MPAVSGPQYRAMMMAKLGKSKLGIPKSVGEEFVHETPKSKRKGFMKLRP